MTPEAPNGLATAASRPQCPRDTGEGPQAVAAAQANHPPIGLPRAISCRMCALHSHLILRKNDN